MPHCYLARPHVIAHAWSIPFVSDVPLCLLRGCRNVADTLYKLVDAAGAMKIVEVFRVQSFWGDVQLVNTYSNEKLCSGCVIL